MAERCVDSGYGEAIKLDVASRIKVDLVHRQSKV